MTENEAKEKIINRLHQRAGQCMFCSKVGCGHGSNTTLPQSLKLQDVLWAINLDHYFETD